MAAADEAVARAAACRPVALSRSGARDADTGGDDTGNGDADTGDDASANRVDQVLAWLESHGFLSDERFAESRVNARAARYGNLRIRQELKQHGVVLKADAAERLRESEDARAWAVWERRFGGCPTTPAETARQLRFLGARGFSGEAVGRVMRRARKLPIDHEAGAAGG